MATLEQIVAGTNPYFGASAQGAPDEAVVRLNAQSAADAINEIRRYSPVLTVNDVGEVVPDVIEDQYLSRAIRITVYLCTKEGVDSAIGFSENGVTRQYETGDIPPSLLKSITPICIGF